MHGKLHSGSSHVLFTILIIRWQLSRRSSVSLMSQNPSTMELQARLGNNCPILMACYQEVIRTTVSSITARVVVSECVIGDKKLPPGACVIIPYRQMLLDEQIFGADADSFNPLRFVRDPGLVKSSSFWPFGGRLAYCPRRFVVSCSKFVV